MARSLSTSFVRGSLLALGVALPIALVSAMNAACIPDPSGDYQDFKARTANLPSGNPSTADAEVFDSKPPETAVEQLYVGICVTALAAGDPGQALRFYTETKYTPDSAGAASGKLTMTVTPMRGWDTPTSSPTSPANVSRAETRGAGIVVTDVPVTADGRFTARLGTVNLDAEANSISGRAAVIENAELDGLFGSGERFCSTLAGLLTIPYSFPFNAEQNTCLFTKVADGAPLPVIDPGQFACEF